MCFSFKTWDGPWEDDPNRSIMVRWPGFNAWIDERNIKAEAVFPLGKAPFVRTGEDGKEKFEIGTFGLLPFGKSWITKQSDGRKYYNARSETIFSKPTYSAAVKYRRAIVPVSCFYEYSEAEQEPDGKAHLYEICREDNGPILIGSIWEQHPEWGLSISLVTTGPLEQVILEVHHSRSPLVLSPEQATEWLEPRLAQQGIAALMKPWNAFKLTIKRLK